MNEFYQRTFPNGLVLLAERMEGVRSAAFTMLVPAGAAYDPPGKEGMANMLIDLVTRGAGGSSSRELTNRLDSLGVQRGEGAETMHCSVVAATLSTNLYAALEIYTDIVRNPHLPEDEVDAVRSLAVQELQGIEDYPRQKLIIELRRRHIPHPLGKPAAGSLEGISNITHQDLQQHHATTFRPRGTILGIAGDVNWPELEQQVGRLFGDWTDSGPGNRIQLSESGPKLDHIPQETSQTQIGLAYGSVPYRDPEYFNAQGAVTLLSGGSSSRLFTEVREKRGLCYEVSASYHSTRESGSVIVYAGTTQERAQETLDVTLEEVQGLRKNISEAEVNRAKAGLKSSLIMQGESSSARSTSIAADWYHLGRVRTFDEVHQAIDSLNPDSITRHLEHFAPHEFTILTLGPNQLAKPKLSGNPK